MHKQKIKTDSASFQTTLKEEICQQTKLGIGGGGGSRSGLQFQ